MAERLTNANLISDKQDIYSLNISELIEALFPDDKNIEIRYYGVKKIYRNNDATKDILDKSLRFSDSLRRFKNYLKKDGVIYVPKGSLKVRTGESCKNCGYFENHFQEKGVDVGIAVDLVRDAITKKCGKIVLISSDTDLLPALQVVKEENIPIVYVSFSGQTTISLAKVANEHITLKDKAIIQSYLDSIN